jgi:lactate permease
LTFHTSPVAFGALGTWAALAGLPVMSLSAMMGCQLPTVSVFLPAYNLLFYAGPRAGPIECWPVALVAGFSFAIVQAIFANPVGPELPDLIAGLFSLLSVIAFVQYWELLYRPKYDANLDFLLFTEDQLAVLSDESINNKNNNLFSNEKHNTVEKEAIENNSSLDTENRSNIVRDDTSQDEVERLAWKETLLAWSP